MPEQEAFKKLHKQISSLTNLIERLPDGIYRSKPDGSLEFANNAMVRMLGYDSKQELLQLNIISDLYFSPEERRQALRKIDGDPVTIRLKKKDGSELWVEDHGKQIINEKGNLLCYEGVLRDITERLQAEKASTANEKRFAALVHSAADAIICMDENGCIQTWNDSATQLFQFTKEEVVGCKLHDLITPERYRELANQRLKMFLKQGTGPIIGQTQELVGLRKDGTEFPIELSVSGMGQGNRWQAIGIIRDITERKRSESQVLKLATAVEQAAEGILITDKNGNIEYVNPAFSLITGYTEDEILGRNPRILKSDKHDQAFYKQLWDTLLMGNVWKGRFLNKKKDGSLYHEDATISPVRDDTGHIVNFVAVKRDITQEINLERQLQHAQKMETIGTLAGGVAHDFNNLLTVILGNVEFGLQDSQQGQPVHQDLVKIQKAANQARHLVNQLLTFTRQQDSNKNRINLNDSIDDVLKMLRRIIGEDIRLITHFDPDLNQINADTTQIQQILLNLCVNARDAMPDGGQIIFETCNVTTDMQQNLPCPPEKPGTYVLLKVYDSGTGMDQETKQRIFEPFFTTKDVGKGTGLGLSVVYGIVKQHAGYIDVSSEESNGTTFYIYFPVKQKSVVSSRTRKITPGYHGSEKILLIEDDEAVLNVTTRLLKSLGYEIKTAGDAEQSSTIIDSLDGQISLVILDMVLPGTSGLDIYKQIRKHKADLPVLFITGYDLRNHLKTIDKLKYTDLLHKPFTMETLGGKVRKLLDS